jgi:hypothetical protein
MTLADLQCLEVESIDILSGAAAEAEKPVMLYNIGKDGAGMLHLARKAFCPLPPPFSAAACGRDLEFPDDVRTARPNGAGERHGTAGLSDSEAAERGINPSTMARYVEDGRVEAGAQPLRRSTARGAPRRRVGRRSGFSRSARRGTAIRRTSTSIRAANMNGTAWPSSPLLYNQANKYMPDCSYAIGMDRIKC